MYLALNNSSRFTLEFIERHYDRLNNSYCWPEMSASPPANSLYESMQFFELYENKVWWHRVLFNDASLQYGDRMSNVCIQH